MLIKNNYSGYGIKSLTPQHITLRKKGVEEKEMSSFNSGEKVHLSTAVTQLLPPPALEEEFVQIPEQVVIGQKDEKPGILYKMTDNVTGNNYGLMSNTTGPALAIIPEEVTKETKPDYNLKNLTKADEIVPKSDIFLAGKDFKIATAGYSAPPEGYEGTTTEFLSALTKELGADKTGFVTSPTADKGSIDAITSMVGQEQKSPVLYITAKDYVEYINPDNFPEKMDKGAYERVPKYVFPDGAEYSKATAVASNAFLATGGRDATVSDFVNAIEKGNKAVVMDNASLGGVEWNDKKNRPNNGARYIIEQIDAFKKGEPLPYPDCKGFNREFLEKNSGKLDDLVKVVTINSSADIQEAAKIAAKHISKPDFNLVNLTKAEEIVPKSDLELAGKDFKIATAGYSAPPEGYEGTTTEFLSALTKELGADKTGFVTSPTADKGSIDAITSMVGQEQKSPVLYITAKDYVEYINPDNFPEKMDKGAYGKAPKYVFPDGAEYSKATAVASNAFLATGGRDATVSDFVNAIENGNKAVVMDNASLGGVEWNDKKNRPNNGARYIIEQIDAFKKGEPLPYPDCKGFNREFLEKNSGKLDDLVKVVAINNSADIPLAAKVAAEHIKGLQKSE